MARMDDREKFEYLLGRGIKIRACDQDGNNTVFKLV